MNLTISMRMQVQSLALLSGLRISCCCELWYRLAAAALIQPLVGEFLYVEGATLKKKKRFIDQWNSICWEDAVELLL